MLTTARLLILVMFPTCPKTCASEVQEVDPEPHLNLLSVLGKSLRHDGTSRHVKSKLRTAVKFELTDATRPILTVKTNLQALQRNKDHPIQGSNPELR